MIFQNLFSILKIDGWKHSQQTQIYAIDTDPFNDIFGYNCQNIIKSLKHLLYKLWIENYDKMKLPKLLILMFSNDYNQLTVEMILYNIACIEN